jgi:replicative DNA helicase
MHITEIVPDVLKSLEEQNEHPNTITGFKTGFVDLDKITSGFQPGELVVIASRPSIGTTAFTQSIIANRLDDPESSPSILIVCPDVSKEIYTRRLLITLSKVDGTKLRKRELESGDLERLRLAANTLNQSSINIIDKQRISKEEIYRIAGEFKSENGLDLILVDSLLTLRFDGENQNRKNELDQSVQTLKNLARKFEVPIVAVASLNRRVERRQDQRPMLSDLKGSDCIEDVADKVLLLYRRMAFNTDVLDPEDSELFIVKNNCGPTGFVRLQFVGKYPRFFKCPISSVLK